MSHRRDPASPDRARRRRRPSPELAQSLASEDAWVDVVFDDAASLLEEERLDLELLVFYDPVTETLHAVGYDGAPARYFRVLEDLPTTEEATPTVGTTSSTSIETEERPLAPPPAVLPSEEERPLPLPLTALAGSSAPTRPPHVPQDEEDRASSNGPIG